MKVTELRASFRLAFKRPIAFNPWLAKISGSVEAGLFLSQALYWTDVVEEKEDSDGWFYKTGEEWTEETTMGRRAQEGARRILLKLGVLEESRRGMPAKMHYRVNLPRLSELLEQVCAVRTSQIAQSEQTGLRDTGKPYKEAKSTSESTPESTSDISSFSLRSKEGEEVKPSTKGKKEQKSKTDSGVEAVYECYPRKKSRGAALKAIEGAVKRLMESETGQPFTSREEALMFLARRVGLYARSPAGNKGQWTPYPATWFNQSCYLDDEKEWDCDDRQQQKTRDEIRHDQGGRNIAVGLGYGASKIPATGSVILENSSERGCSLLLEGRTERLPGGKG